MLALSRRLLAVCLISSVLLSVVGCGSSEKATVVIQYALNPDKGLPPGMQTVAILDAQVNEVTDRKWSELAANGIQAMVQDSNDHYGTNLRLADRKHTASVMQESDLAAAGLTASTNPGKVAQVLNVQGFIMAEINVKVEKHQGKGRTIDAMSMFAGGGHGWGHGGGGVSSSEVDKENRHIIVQTDFKLVDASTSENWVTHTSSYRQTDKTKVSPFFGSSKTEEAMTPRDEIIGAAVENGARRFLARIIPCTVWYEVELKSSGNEYCAKGVSFLRGDMTAEAMQQFKMALAEDPEDHRAAFGAGVACEMTGQYSEALDYYKRACVMEGKPEYLEAKKRLSENLDRIRTGDST